MSGEDDTVGYDIQSFRLKEGDVVPYYIEVKGTTALEPKFFLSNNQWGLYSVAS